MKHICVILFCIQVFTNSFAQTCTSHLPVDTLRERAIQHWLATNQAQLAQRTSISIPVVVHVVWRLPEQQISEAQILSQINVLNQDFSALNGDLSNVPIDFQDKIADLEIEFCLAQQTPDGEPTDGITYTQTSVVNVGTAQTNGIRTIYYSSLGGKDAWNPDHYLNIWVAERGFVCGESSFPEEAGSPEDGIVIRYDCFGTLGTAEAPYHLGRTATHEVGHYFNLLHLWGSGENDFACLEDDLVGDTPLQAFSYLEQCPVPPQMSCGSLDMFMNFMNFSDDACLNMFSKGQKERVWAAINMNRSGLMESIGCLPAMVDASEERFLSSPIKLINPSFDPFIRLEVENTAALPFNIQLFQLDGRLVQTAKWRRANTLSLNCADLSNGIYILVANSDSRLWSQKVSIIK